MSFLNPFVLFGLIATSIPLLLHLINLRKQKDIEFSSLRFLKELKKTEIKKLKLKQLLLLILRILIITFIVLAFSRPTINSNIPGFIAESKSSNIILIDNSHSMDYNDEIGNRYVEQKKIITDIINSFKDGDEATIIELSGTKSINSYKLLNDKNELKILLQNLKLSNLNIDLENGLLIAKEILKESKNINKNIYIASDFQSNVFTNFDTTKQIDNNINVFVQRVGLDNNLNNVAIDSVILNTKIFKQNDLVEISLFVRNYSNNDINNQVVNLYFNQQNVAQRSVTVPANKSIKIDISAPVKFSGAISGKVVLEQDGFDKDNTKYFTFAIPDKQEIAVIADDETNKYYELLSKLDEFKNAFNFSFFKQSQFGGVNLNDYNAVLLSSVQLTSNDENRLKSYVEQGGGLFIMTTPDNKQSLASNFGFIGQNANLIEFKGEAGKFGLVDLQHPIFDGVFTGSTSKNQIVESPQIKKATLADFGKRIIELNGKSLFSELRYSYGKCIFLGITANESSSNLAFTGIFPTLIYRGLFYLSLNESLNNIAKNSKYLELPTKKISNDRVKIVFPNGENSLVNVNKLNNSSNIDITSFTTLGSYQIYNDANKLIGIFSVNFDKTESNLALEKEYQAKLKSRLKDEKNIYFADNKSSISQVINEATLGSELWKLFVILALIAAVAEMIVARNTKHESE